LHLLNVQIHDILLAGETNVNNPEYLAEKTYGQLKLGSPVIIATIINQQGSLPRHVGAKMVICPDGQYYGTIGGSLLEAITIKEAKSCLESRQSKLVDFDLSGHRSGASGMICGGKATVLLDYIESVEENVFLFSVYLNAINKGKEFILLTSFKGTDNMPSVINRCLVLDDGNVVGKSPVSGQSQEYILEEIRGFTSPGVLHVNDLRIVIDPIRRVKTVFCFGAGHVAVPTAHLASLVGFRVVVVDDREEYSCRERFQDACEVRVIKDFDNALGNLDIDEDSFIVIVTRGHEFDHVVLEQALTKNAGYIGMISSRNKRDVIFQALRAKGFTQDELDRVHSPIGLDIGAETPEEIAVSIVGELIAVRAGKIS